jgi:hypothetical integral membrane protein (TIGR02206 family)
VILRKRGPMGSAGPLDTFHAWSLTHWVVIFGCIIVSITLAAMRRKVGRPLDLVLAPLTAVSWLVIQLVQATSERFSLNTSLPLHVSDLTLLIVPIALWTQRRWTRAILYYWGLALGSLAFLIPDLHDGPAHIGFWFFWIGHTIIIAAVVYDLFGRDYRPTWGDFAIAALASTIYAAVIVPFNAITHLSYGYLGPDQAAQPAILHHFGPWPLRVVPLVLTGLFAMAALTLPWRLRRFEALFPRHYNKNPPPEEWQSGRMRRS